MPPGRLLALSLLLPACSTERVPALASDPARQEVLQELERYYADFSARDWKAFAGHFWPGATLTTVWQPPGEPAPRVSTFTVPEFVARVPQGPDSKPIFEERMASAAVRHYSDLAHAGPTTPRGSATRPRSRPGKESTPLP